MSETVAIAVGIDLRRAVNRLLPQLVFQNVARNVSVVLQAQFFHDPCAIGADSLGTEVESFGDFDQQAIRVTARYDAAPLNPKAFVTLTGITRP